MNTSANEQDAGWFRSDVIEPRGLILGIFAAYVRGENAMEYARCKAGSSVNAAISTRIADMVLP